MKQKRWIALLLAAALSVGALGLSAFAAEDAVPTPEAAEQRERQAGHGGRGSREKIEKPENAIGREAAREIALQDAGLSPEQLGSIKVRLWQTEDGTVVYRLHFCLNGQRWSYRIDAVSGEILERNVEELPEQEQAQSEHSRDRSTEEGSRQGEQAERQTQRGHDRKGARGGRRNRSRTAEPTEQSSPEPTEQSSAEA